MNTDAFAKFFTILALSLCWAQLAPAYTPPKPATEVATVEYTWHDAKRNRDVPVKIYYPKTGSALPIVIFSHGLGGTREGYEYFGQYLAGCGYVSVHVQHIGSDDSVWRGKELTDFRGDMQKAALKPENLVNRPRDISFAIDQMLDLNARKNPFSHRLDSNRIAVAGHSFGAWTTLVVAGETVAGKSFADPRVKAAIAMSPPAREGQNPASFDSVGIPTLHFTGTQDDSPVFNMPAANRRIPFDHASRAPAFLVTFNGATHMTFARLRKSASAEDENFHSEITATSVAFLDGYLRNDAGAKQWLTGDGINQLLGTSASVERKP